MNRRVPMTAGRRVALIIGVPLALLIIGWHVLSAAAYAGQATYPVRLDLPVHGGAVRVSIDSGDLRGGPGASDRLRLTGTAHYSLVRSTVTWHATPSGVTVVSRCHFVTGECSFRYQVGLPAGSQAFLSDRSGDITVTGVTAADVTASDGSGNVTLTFARIPGRVRVSDQFGDVTLLLPSGRTTYRVSTHALFGETSIGVPTSASSPHVITVTDPSGGISIRNQPRSTSTTG
jgi:hypothetical protein